MSITKLTLISASVAAVFALVPVSAAFAQYSGQPEDESQTWSRAGDSLRQEQSDKTALEVRTIVDPQQRILIAQCGDDDYDYGYGGYGGYGRGYGDGNGG